MKFALVILYPNLLAVHIIKFRSMLMIVYNFFIFAFKTKIFFIKQKCIFNIFKPSEILYMNIWRLNCKIFAACIYTFFCWCFSIILKLFQTFILLNSWLFWVWYFNIVNKRFINNKTKLRFFILSNFFYLLQIILRDLILISIRPRRYIVNVLDISKSMPRV